MKFREALKINVKKLRIRTGKALFLVIPIALLAALSFIISSQVKNVQQAMDENIFAEIEEESTVLEVVYQVNVSERGFGFMQSENVFTEADLELITFIDNVDVASMNYKLPVSSIVAEDLFDDMSLQLMEVSALNEDMAAMYTSEDFRYVEGEPIPIILNAGMFLETYEDWGGSDEYTVDFRAIRDGGGDPRQSIPVKTKAIEYDTEELMGKEFTVIFGGFNKISNVETEMSAGVVTFRKISEDDVADLEEERKSAINEYWDYDVLADGLTYSFVVVGVSEEEGSLATYVPEEFANSMMEKYILLQLENNLAAPSADLLDSTYTGLKYDGLELSRGGFSGVGGGGGMGRPRGMGGMIGGSSEGDGSSYEIPGLVIETLEDGSGEVVGIYEDAAVFAEALKSGDTISVKIVSIYDRGQVIDDINDLGYAYQDISDLDVFYEVQSTLDSISSGLIVGFIGLTVAVIILTMSKFVSESRKEIGIFRAIGFTKGNILLIFMLQSLLYTAVGYALGVVLGVGLNFAISPVIAGWFDGLVTSTVSETFNVVGSVDYRIFAQLDLKSAGILSIILLVTAFIISFIPAYTASNVSPVEAIRNE